jgi:hypothetical protein
MVFMQLSSTTQQLRSRLYTGSLGLLYFYFSAFDSKVEKCIGQPLMSVERMSSLWETLKTERANNNNNKKKKKKKEEEEI